MVFSGKGTYIWNLTSIYGGDVEKIVAELKRTGTKGVACKIHDGVHTSGGRDWDTPLMWTFRMACRGAGIAFGLWGYIRLDDPVGEATLAGAMCEKYEADFYLIDAEKEAKGKVKQAKAFAAELALQVMVPIGLASYRFPNLHRELAWGYLRGASCDFDSPQVYYRAGDPVAQLSSSKAQFSQMLPKLPFFPAGDMYSEGGYKPTPGQVRRFLQAADLDPEIDGCLMWVMDQMTKVPELWRAYAEYEWGSGAGNQQVFGARATGNVWVRTGPSSAYPKVKAITTGAPLEILEERYGWGRIREGWLSMTWVTRA